MYNLKKRKHNLKIHHFITCWVCLEKKGAGQAHLKGWRLPEDCLITSEADCAAATNDPKISAVRSTDHYFCPCHVTLVGLWVCVHHTAPGTQADGIVCIRAFVSPCGKSSKWSQTYNLMLQLQEPQPLLLTTHWLVLTPGLHSCTRRPGSLMLPYAWKYSANQM